jgi:hypothetical protein
LRPAQANSSQDPISKITREKWTGGVAHTIECLLCMHKALSSNPSLTKTKKVEWWISRNGGEGPTGVC